MFWCWWIDGKHVATAAMSYNQGISEELDVIALKAAEIDMKMIIITW